MRDALSELGLDVAPDAAAPAFTLVPADR